jgi:PhnB protein
MDGMIGVEIDMVVQDSLAAFALYKRVFGAEEIEITSCPKGQNEAVFTMFDTRFHLLDENHEYGLYARAEDKPQSMWCNLVIEDIVKTFQNAKEAEFRVIQPVTHLEDFGLMNAIIADPFGYVWMLHQIIKEVSFEERIRLMEDMNKQYI